MRRVNSGWEQSQQSSSITSSARASSIGGTSRQRIDERAFLEGLQKSAA
jgi:hypothetical protein